jgi:hypothetical protein
MKFKIGGRIKFEIGDRVSCYWTEDLSHSYRERGTVDYINYVTGIMSIKLDDGGNSYYHHKQCRKLVKKPKKEPREIWVNIHENGILSAYHNPRNAVADEKHFKLREGAVRFVRAKKQ